MAGQRAWALPPIHRKVLQLSALGDISAIFRQANLPIHKAALERADLWTEAAMLSRLLYKNESQHRGAHFMRFLKQVDRGMQQLQSLQLPALLGDLQSMIDLAAGSAASAPVRSAASYFGTGSGPAARQTHRLPSREACVFSMVQIMAGCKLLEGVLSDVLAAGLQLSAQVAMSFFMPLCLTALAMLARMRVLGSQLLIDCIKAYNALTGLLPVLPVAGDAIDMAAKPKRAAGADDLAVDFTCASFDRLQQLLLPGAAPGGAGGSAGAAGGSDGALGLLPPMLGCQWRGEHLPAVTELDDDDAAGDAAGGGKLLLGGAAGVPLTQGSRRNGDDARAEGLHASRRRLWAARAAALWDELQLMQGLEAADLAAASAAAAAAAAADGAGRGAGSAPGAAAAATAAAAGAAPGNKSTRGAKQQQQQPASKGAAAAAAAPAANDLGVKVDRRSFFEMMGSRQMGTTGARTSAAQPRAQLRVFEDRGSKGSAAAAAAAAPEAAAAVQQPDGVGGAVGVNASATAGPPAKKARLAAGAAGAAAAAAGSSSLARSRGGVDHTVGCVEDALSPVVPVYTAALPGLVLGMGAPLGAPQQQQQQQEQEQEQQQEQERGQQEEQQQQGQQQQEEKQQPKQQAQGAAAAPAAPEPAFNAGSAASCHPAPAGGIYASGTAAQPAAAAAAPTAPAEAASEPPVAAGAASVPARSMAPKLVPMQRAQPAPAFIRIGAAPSKPAAPPPATAATAQQPAAAAAPATAPNVPAPAVLSGTAAALAVAPAQPPAALLSKKKKQKTGQAAGKPATEVAQQQEGKAASSSGWDLSDLLNPAPTAPTAAAVTSVGAGKGAGGRRGAPASQQAKPQGSGKQQQRQPPGGKPGAGGAATGQGSKTDALFNMLMSN